MRIPFVSVPTKCIAETFDGGIVETDETVVLSSTTSRIVPHWGGEPPSGVPLKSEDFAFFLHAFRMHGWCLEHPAADGKYGHLVDNPAWEAKTPATVSLGGVPKRVARDAMRELHCDLAEVRGQIDVVYKRCDEMGLEYWKGVVDSEGEDADADELAMFADLIDGRLKNNNLTLKWSPMFHVHRDVSAGKLFLFVLPDDKWRSPTYSVCDIAFADEFTRKIREAG